jgi:phage-related protein
MLDVLSQILCWISAIANAVLWAFMTAINAIFAGIGAALTAVISLLPNMPTAPDWSGVATSVFGYANWVFPVGFLVTTIASIAVLWLGWKAVSTILRIGKVVE